MSLAQNAAAAVPGPIGAWAVHRGLLGANDGQAAEGPHLDASE
jgi:hypothetical protein